MALDYSLPRRWSAEKLSADQRLLLFRAAGCGAHWRVLDLWSDTDLPFEVEIGWSAGGGAGQRALVTIARACRVVVYARDLTIWATNLTNTDNAVSVSVTDSETMVQTSNVYEVQTEAPQAGGEVTCTVPPYARRFRLELADNSLLSTATIRLYDGSSTLRAEIPGSEQGDGVLVGGARSITLEDAGVARLVFELQL